MCALDTKNGKHQDVTIANQQVTADSDTTEKQDGMSDDDNPATDRGRDEELSEHEGVMENSETTDRQGIRRESEPMEHQGRMTDDKLSDIKEEVLENSEAADVQGVEKPTKQNGDTTDDEDSETFGRNGHPSEHQDVETT